MSEVEDSEVSQSRQSKKRDKNQNKRSQTKGRREVGQTSGLKSEERGKGNAGGGKGRERPMVRGRAEGAGGRVEAALR